MFLIRKSTFPQKRSQYIEIKFPLPKGQIKPKAVWVRRRFYQKTNEWICFVCHEKQKSKQKKFICSFFGRIYGAPICFWFYLTSRRTSSTILVTLFLYFNLKKMQKMFAIYGFHSEFSSFKFFWFFPTSWGDTSFYKFENKLWSSKSI